MGHSPLTAMRMPRNGALTPPTTLGKMRANGVRDCLLRSVLIAMWCSTWWVTATIYSCRRSRLAITSQPERTGPGWFGKVATRALSPLKPGYASAASATAVQAYPSAARSRARRRRLERTTS
jgi:hypothetical protein